MADTTTLDSSEVAEVLSARNARALFGENRKRARIRYHRLARSVHPDAPGGSEEAMARLNALWDEYNGSPKASKAGKKSLVEVSRSEDYVAFEEDGTILVVGRAVCSDLPATCDAEALEKSLEGTPTGIFAVTDKKLIAQPDGPHAAYSCKWPDDAPVFVQELIGRLPKGNFDPRDLAWVSKRVVFIASAMQKQGLGFVGDAVSRLVVLPKAHMVQIACPWDLVEADDHEKVRGIVIESYLRAITPAIGRDHASKKLEKWLFGASMDNVTPSSDLMNEYDWLCRGLFGPPAYHELVLSEKY